MFLGQEIKFPSEKKSETKTSLDLKNNGVIQNAIVTANTFSLPFVCPKKDKELISVRKEHGLKLEKAIQNRDEAVQDLEEDANTGKCKLFYIHIDVVEGVLGCLHVRFVLST